MEEPEAKRRRGEQAAAVSEREQALLQDLILARDALEQMKTALSQRARYDPHAAGARASDELRPLQRASRRLKKELLQTRNRLERRERALDTLARLLGPPEGEGEGGGNGDREDGGKEVLDEVRRVLGRIRGPMQLRMVLRDAPVAAERPIEVEVRKKTVLRPPLQVQVEGDDVLSTPELAVRVHAVQGSQRVEGVLAGTLLVTLNTDTQVASFEDLQFVKLSQQCNGLPVGLSFELVQRGVPLETPVQILDTREYLITNTSSSASAKEKP